MVSEEEYKKYIKFVRKLSEEPSTRFELSKACSVSPTLLHAQMGLVTEAAEVTDLVKKHVGYERSLDIQKLKDELGDMLFYWTLAVDECKSTFKEIMKMNMAKLTARYIDGYSNEEANNRDLKVEQEAQQKESLVKKSSSDVRKSEVDWHQGDTAEVKDRWFRAGQKFEVLGPAVFFKQWWVPVIDPADKDPIFYEEAGLQKVKNNNGGEI